MLSGKKTNVRKSFQISKLDDSPLAVPMGLPNLADDFDTEMDRMIWMVQMLYKHPSLQADSRWRLAEA